MTAPKQYLPRQLEAHRSRMEHDVLAKSPAYRALLRAAAKEYDAAMKRAAEGTKGGRPKKCKPLIVDRRKAA